MEAQEMVALLRRVRHDFANHIQVIGGYLDMGQPESVKQYLTKVMEEINSEKIVFQSLSGEAALYFYEQLAMARDLGIILRYEDIDIASWEILKSSNEPYRSILALSKETVGADEDVIIFLSLYEDRQGIDIFLSNPRSEYDSRKIRVNKE